MEAPCVESWFACSLTVQASAPWSPTPGQLRHSLKLSRSQPPQPSHWLHLCSFICSLSRPSTGAGNTRPLFAAVCLYLAQCLAHSRYSINIVSRRKMNKTESKSAKSSLSNRGSKTQNHKVPQTPIQGHWVSVHKHTEAEPHLGSSGLLL